MCQWICINSSDEPYVNGMQQRYECVADNLSVACAAASRMKVAPVMRFRLIIYIAHVKNTQDKRDVGQHEGSRPVAARDYPAH
jgi:hypothetical protein